MAIENGHRFSQHLRVIEERSPASLPTLDLAVNLHLTIGCAWGSVRGSTVISTARGWRRDAVGDAGGIYRSFAGRSLTVVASKAGSNQFGDALIAFSHIIRPRLQAHSLWDREAGRVPHEG
jgi:hypothetical protein